MKPTLRLCLIGALALAGACSTPESRIRRNRELFATYPPDVQQDIRAGKVRIGFTQDMVRLALGDPDLKFTEASAAGVRDVWAYTGGGIRPGLGLSIGGAVGGPVGVGGGVSAADGSYAVERVRLVFDGGRLAAIEKPQRY